MGVFGMLFLAVLAIIGNSGSTAINNITTQFNRLACPMPSQTGLWNASGVIQYSGATYNYPSVSNQTLTLTCTEVHTLDSFDYAYGSPTLSFAGFGFYIGDWISELLANKLSALGTLLYFFVTPANFDILGFTIADLTGIALMTVISLYAICYIFIGAMAYKIISPFSGVG